MAIQRRLGEQYPDTHRSRGGVVRSLHTVVVRDAGPRLRVLLIAVTLILLMACINVAALMVARNLERSSEQAMRVALGATRRRLIQSHLLEGMVLAALGGLLGLAVAYAGIRILAGMESNDFAGVTLSLDRTVLIYALGISFLCGLVFAIAPVLRQTRTLDVRSSSGRITTTRQRAALRQTLVITEIAMAALVLFCLGLALRSYTLLMKQDAGFEPAGVMTFRAALPQARYGKPADIRTFHVALRRNLLEQDGVQAASFVDALPLEPGSVWPVFIDGQPFPPPGEEFQVYMKSAGPGLFETLGIPIIAGRDFRPEEFEEPRSVIIVDRLFAERVWPGQDPLGRQMRHWRDGEWRRVIGVVGPVAHRGMEDGFMPSTYVPEVDDEMSVVIRLDQPMTAVVPRVMATLAALDPGIPLARLRTGAMLIEDDTAGRRFDSVLLAFLAAVALALAAVGTYGVLSALVLQKRVEIGVRMALGESTPSILLRVLRQAVVLAGTGLLVGFLVTLAAARPLSALVFGITPTDPATYVIVAIVITLSALAAALLPAVRAASVGALEAIRGRA
jgi:putative ABC transport system permease protein